jgi:hypothetical protein
VLSRAAKILVTVSAIICALAGAIIDLGTDTHVFNPTWPAHAKYHDVMFIYVSAGIGIACLWLAWSKRSRADHVHTVRIVSWLLGIMWTAFFVALLVPGASAVTPGMPQPLGIPVNVLSAFVGLLSVPLIYWLETTTKPA